MLQNRVEEKNYVADLGKKKKLQFLSMEWIRNTRLRSKSKRGVLRGAEVGGRGR
jgi:hypothetical protein